MKKHKQQSLPKSVMVLGHKFTIKWDHAFDDGDFGDTDILEREIRIGKRCDTADKRASTYFHEIIHAAIGVAGHEHSLGEKLEESLVTGLENALYPLLDTVLNVRKIERKD